MYYDGEEIISNVFKPGNSKRQIYCRNWNARWTSLPRGGGQSPGLVPPILSCKDDSKIVPLVPVELWEEHGPGWMTNSYNKCDQQW